MKSAIATTALSLALGMLFSGAALAANEVRYLTALPADRCQGALPSFEGALRKRPLAVQNEGSTNAFVTCAFAMETGQAVPGSYKLFVGVSSSPTNTTDTDVTCTAVLEGGGADNQYATKTVSLSPGEGGELFWRNEDFVSGIDNLVAISCNLAPGIGVNWTDVSWVENDNEGA